MTGSHLPLLGLFSLGLCLPGACSSHVQSAGTGGIHFPHIKTFTFLIGTSGELDEGEIAWLAERVDLAVGQLDDRALWKAASPEIKLCEGRPLEFFWGPGEDEEIRDWGVAHGRDYEKAYMHYRVDTYVDFLGLTKKGWNPDDDEGQCGGTAGDWVNDLIANVDGTCTGEPSDPQRTAPRAVDARVQPWPEQPDWRMPNVLSAEWQDWAVSQIVDAPGYDPDLVDCVWEDNAIYYPWGIWELEKTIEYWGIPEKFDDTTPNLDHPFIEDRPRGGAEFIELLSQAMGKDVFGWPNVGATWPHTESPFNEVFRRHFDHVFVEWWLYGTAELEGGPDYASAYENSIVKILELTRRFNEVRHLKVNDYLATATDRRKILGLASFYLVNNANTYFSYLIGASADYPERGTDHPSNFMWFDAIERDIGQPVINHLGLPDYLGDTGTTQHFVFASGPDPGNPGETYHLLGREYERALVLVKFRQTKDSAIGDSTRTTHALGGTYRPLATDGSVGDPVSGITLANSEAAILLKD